MEDDEISCVAYTFTASSEIRMSIISDGSLLLRGDGLQVQELLILTCNDKSIVNILGQNRSAAGGELLGEPAFGFYVTGLGTSARTMGAKTTQAAIFVVCAATVLRPVPYGGSQLLLSQIWTGLSAGNS